MFLQKFSVMIILAVLVAHNIFNGHFYIHQTDWTSSLNLTDIPWIVEVVHLSLQISSSRFNCTRFLNYFICMHHWKIQKKYISATWLYSVDFYMWYFDLFCGLISFVILHCDDGIRHVEAVLEEPTNWTNLDWLIDWKTEEDDGDEYTEIFLFHYWATYTRTGD